MWVVGRDGAVATGVGGAAGDGIVVLPHVLMQEKEGGLDEVQRNLDVTEGGNQTPRRPRCQGEPVDFSASVWQKS